MKKQHAVFLTAILAGALCTSAFAAGDMGRSATGQSATSGTSQQQERQRAGQQLEQSEFKAVADLAGMPIQNQQGQEIGTIDQVLVDMNQGRLAFVVVKSAGGSAAGTSAGTTAGTAASTGQSYIIPWQMVRTTPRQDGLMADVASVTDLRPVPAGEQIEQTLTRQTGREIFQFYGISPYWEESGQQQEQMRQMMERMPQDQMHQQMMDRMHQPNQQQPTPQSPR